MHYDLTYFIKQGNAYQRFEDYQCQTYFSLDTIEKELRSAGFGVLELSDDYTELPCGQQTERIVITAKKENH